MRQRILATAGVVLLVALFMAPAHADTTTTSTTDGTVNCLALGCPGSPTTTSTSLSIPAGCAVFPCRTSDGNPPDTTTSTTTAPTPVARFTG